MNKKKEKDGEPSAKEKKAIAAALAEERAKRQVEAVAACDRSGG
jgi:hypothetical protein